MRKASLLALILCSSALIAPASAKDFGRQGKTEQIKERDILKVMREKLEEKQRNGEIDAMNQKFKRQALATAKRPKPVAGLVDATEDRTFLVDMSKTFEEDVRTPEGKLIARAGRTVNPLEYQDIARHLVFIDGDDTYQVEWALDYAKQHPTKIILTKGEPFKLSKENKVRFYFDQDSSLINRFQISALPAAVFQDGLSMRVKEVAL